MLCERCKLREANIQYTEIVNGVKKEHHFCAQCARELDFGPYSAIFDTDFPLGKLLSGLLGIGEAQEEENTHQVVCPTCKTTYEEFVKNSRFGCPDCYGVFDPLISDKIKQLQGSGVHKGKRPKHREQEEKKGLLVESLASGGEKGESNPLEEQIEVLNARLQDALKREAYEEAAKFRDQIRALKKDGSQAEAGGTAGSVPEV